MMNPAYLDLRYQALAAMPGAGDEDGLPNGSGYQRTAEGNCALEAGTVTSLGF